MKKVLIIVYYWPPTGGSGVQRWVKFVKHLRSFGWEPVIYTALDPFVQERDATLLADIPAGVEVLKQPVFEITRFFGNPSAGGAKGKSPSLFSKLKKAVGNYIRGTFFVPDPRITWVEPSVKFLDDYLKNHKIDVIVSSGPPHSLHLIAQRLKQQLSIPWLADFRDPWIEILDFHGFKVSAKAKAKHQKLFEQVITTADSVIVAHTTVQRDFQKITKTPVKLITNGYDEADLLKARAPALSKEKFKMVFVGILYNKLNSPAFWKAISLFIDADSKFRNSVELILVGKVDSAATDDIKNNGLMRYCRFVDYVEHVESLAWQKAADVLLLFTPVEKSFSYVIPGKLFEYLAIKKPILCIANPENDSANIIRDANAGISVDPTSVTAIRNAVKLFFEKYQAGNLSVSSHNVEQYERKNLTAKLVSELNRISS